MAEYFRVTNETRGEILADRSERAGDPLRRGIGLMGRKSLPEGGGLVIQPCQGVVSFFMRFPIDVLFVGDDGEIRHVIHSMRPWRTSSIVRGSRYVVELPPGTAERTGTVAGDRLRVDRA